MGETKRVAVYLDYEQAAEYRDMLSDMSDTYSDETLDEWWEADDMANGAAGFSQGKPNAAMCAIA